MKKDRRIDLCGLGTRPTHETTLEVLQAFEDASTVFCDVDDPALLRWLKPFCRRLVPLKPGLGTQAAARKVVAAAGPSVCLAVWGHPLLSSPLSLDVLRSARARKVPVRLLAAVSPVGSAFARSVSFLGGDYGYQGIQAHAFDAAGGWARGLRTDLALVLYAATAEPSWSGAAPRLAAHYPASHGCWVYGGGSAGAPEARVTVGALAQDAPRGAILFVPPLRAPLDGGGR